jgi:hypothetical protein
MAAFSRTVALVGIDYAIIVTASAGWGVSYVALPFDTG